MRNIISRRSVVSKFLALALAIAPSAFAEPLIKDGDKLAICGDSITEQKWYSVFIEDYLTLCQPAQVEVTQFGWGGETAPGFAGRMNRDVLWQKPTIATTCYGMNDGGYRPVSDGTRNAYRDSMTRVVKTFTDAGVRVIVGSPGVVDTVTAGERAKYYNDTLAALRDEARAVAEATGQTFANVHDPMMQATIATKAKFGDAYPLAGNDGVHPHPSGQLVMAHAFLKAMRFDGQIALIEMDLAAGSAKASDGHKVTESAKGSVTIESTRYPFCFSDYGAKPEKPQSLRGIVPLTTFNQDLNRFTLKVVAPAGNYRVKWGEATKDFSSQQLAEGINLAAEFLDNPFSKPFADVEKAIRAKQEFETRAFKQLLPSLSGGDLLKPETINQVRSEVMEKHAALRKAAKDAVQPVKHTISVEPVPAN